MVDVFFVPRGMFYLFLFFLSLNFAGSFPLKCWYHLWVGVLGSVDVTYAFATKIQNLGLSCIMRSKTHLRNVILFLRQKKIFGTVNAKVVGSTQWNCGIVVVNFCSVYWD